MVAPASAQQNPQSPTTDVGQPQAAASGNTVVVTGIRASMQSTLNLKKNSDGVVDGIVADDIGKFPDTNLAEAVQRISGVSIDRSRGEGAQVTIRGVGPDLNMVLLNGRQMPTANLGDQAGRAFDFSNLASEAVSQIQVYKSARADVPPGGIGATLNIMTGRPLDLGNQTSIGGKIVYDRSNNNLPDIDAANHSYAPEVSGLISRKFLDGKFGVAVSASHQRRNSGFNQAAVTNGWLGPFQAGDDTSASGTVPANGAGVVNAPQAGTIYSTPQNLSYFLTGSQRKRTNGQVTFQFRPVKDFTATLDYTYAENKVQTKGHELSVWFGHDLTRQSSVFNNGPIASPLYYEEDLSNADMVTNGHYYGTKSTLKSTGFNAQWRVNSDLRLSFDGHHSIAEAGADSPFGSNNSLGTASFSRGNTSVDFSQEMPVLRSSADYAAAPNQVTGSFFDDTYNKMTVDQVQVGGRLSVRESSNLNFGLASTKTKYRSMYQRVEQSAWSGTSKNPGVDYDQRLWQADSLRKYFSKLGGASDPTMYDQIELFDFAGVRENAAQLIGADKVTPSSANPSINRNTREKSNSLYAQLNTDWDTTLPMHTGIGVRYEKTKVTSDGFISDPVQVNWVAQNELPVTQTPAAMRAMTGEYHNWLPTLDWDMEVRPDLKLRASWGVSIGRPRWDQIQGGVTYNSGAGVNGITANRGNPALTPVKSKNLDVSAEWYYTKQSMLSLGLFHKDLTGYAGQTVITEPSATATTPVGGAYWNAALNSGCNATDTNCMRDYILGQFNGRPGVTATGVDSKGHLTGTISGVAGDPALPVLVTTYVNQDKASLKGAEINWQHMFNNGFGVQANYTYVKSDLTYNNRGLGNQFALVGLSNSANLVGIYEDKNWSVRAAYNWRGEFLANVADAGHPNPAYVEPYGQLDVSVGYNVNKNLSLSLEAINLTDATMRTHSRTEAQVLTVTTGGPRFMVGARYKF